MKKEVLIIRHPEIERGSIPRCYGHTDLGLTPRGVGMIASLVARAADWQPDAVLSSDLRRCLQPAQAIAAIRGLTVEPNPVWREIFMGDWEDQSWDDLKTRHPELLQDLTRDYVTVRAPGGESYEQLADRTFAALKGLEPRPERKIWIMTHGGVIRTIVSRIIGLPLEQSWKIETAYAAGVLVRWTGETWKVIFV